MQWISLKDEIPLLHGNGNLEFCLAYHSVYGVGVAWFWKFNNEELQNDPEGNYLCSCQFIKNKLDGNYLIEDEYDIDIFENSPFFHNLGTVTHWMPLPEPPI